MNKGNKNIYNRILGLDSEAGDVYLKMVSMVDKYPSFQPAIFLLLKYLYDNKSLLFDAELKRLSINITDRKQLFLFLQDDSSYIFSDEMECLSFSDTQTNSEQFVYSEGQNNSSSNIEDELPVDDVILEGTTETAEETIAANDTNVETAELLTRAVSDVDATNVDTTDVNTTSVGATNEENDSYNKSLEVLPVDDVLLEDTTETAEETIAIEEPITEDSDFLFTPFVIKNKVTPKVTENNRSKNLDKSPKSVSDNKQDMYLLSGHLGSVSSSVLEYGIANTIVNNNTISNKNNVDIQKDSLNIKSIEKHILEEELISRDRFFNGVDTFSISNLVNEIQNKKSSTTLNNSDLDNVFNFKACGDYFSKEDKESVSRKNTSNSGKKNKLIDDFIESSPGSIVANSNNEKDVVESNAEQNDMGSIVSVTLADVYVVQKLYEKAILIYEKLILKNPKKNAYFAGKIEEIKKLKNK